MPPSRRPDVHDLICGFCGRPRSETRRLLGGLGVMICADCAREAVRSFEEGMDDADVVFDALGEQDQVTMLEGVTRLRPQLERFQSELIRFMRGRGASWETISRGLGVARQSAWERFRHVDDR